MNRDSGGSLHDGLVAALREMIAGGELAPGTRVPERQLCERFAVSRTPLREALKVLASEGLVVLLRNRGARIAKPSLRDVEEVLQVMGALETLSGELACARIDDAKLAEIRAMHYQMLAHRLRRETADYFRLNQQIHEAIVEASGNRVLSAMYHSLSGRVRRVRYGAGMTEARWAQAVEDHEAIIEALARRDGTALTRILHRHLAHKCEEIVRAGLVEAEAEAEVAAAPPPRQAATG